MFYLKTALLIVLVLLVLSVFRVEAAARGIVCPTGKKHCARLERCIPSWEPCPRKCEEDNEKWCSSGTSSSWGCKLTCPACVSSFQLTCNVPEDKYQLCVPKSVGKCPVLCKDDSKKCGTGCIFKNQTCTINGTVQCDQGQRKCADNSCVDIDGDKICPCGAGKKKCVTETGTKYCALTCPSGLQVCQGNTSHKCDDGFCVNSTSQCCPKFRCFRGNGQSFCTNNQQNCTCTLAGDFLCEKLGKCTKTEANCTALSSTTCESMGKVTCTNNHCAQSYKECECNKENKIFCPILDKCVLYVTDCKKTTDPCKPKGLETCEYDGETCGPNQDLCNKCLADEEYPCPGGFCADEKDKCMDIKEGFACADFNWVMCSGFNASDPKGCRPEASMCNRSVPCGDYGWEKCRDFCVPESKFCIKSACEQVNLNDCPDGTCKKYKSQCNKTCATYPKLFQCPNGDCVTFHQECDFASCKNSNDKRCSDGKCIPSNGTCCALGQTRCSNGNCTANPQECMSGSQNNEYRNKTQFACPHGEIKCPTGKCAANAQGCVSEFANKTCIGGTAMCECETGQILCPKRGCVFGSSAVDCLACPHDAKTCSDGSCAEEFSDCANNTCPLTTMKCHELSYRCGESKKMCDYESCAVICPQKDGSTYCANTLSGCCRYPTPFFCNDQCVASLRSCGGVICPDNKVKCRDDSCVMEFKDCPCSTGFEKCANGFCVNDNTTDCFNYNSSNNNICEKDQVLCPDNSCAHPGKCGEEKKCPPGFVKCDSGICEQDASDCQAVATCEGSDPFYCKVSGECVDDARKCEHEISCPDNRVLCPDKSCRRNSTMCPPPRSCPQNRPFKCPSGDCTATASECVGGKLCSDNKIKCPNGECEKDISECDALEECDDDEVRCQDSSCADDYESCGTIFKCPTGFIQCENNECRKSLDKCTDAVSCPSGFVKCPSGDCVFKSKTNCPQTSVCTATNPVKCDDGSCKPTISDCPVPFSCPPDAPYKCPDTSCQAGPLECSTSTKCPSTFPILCQDGRCVDDKVNCPDESKLECDDDDVRCGDGSCAEARSLCPVGVTCPSKYPVKCWNDVCKKNISNCPPILDLCPGKVLCPDKHSCRKTIKGCPVAPKCPEDKPIRCHSGQCVKDSDKCEDATCPAGKVLCQSGNLGTCRNNLTECPTQVTCQKEKPIKCRDGTCKKTQRDCKQNEIEECEDNTPLRCFDLTCVASYADCTDTDLKVCADSTPILCPDGTTCVANYTQCVNITASSCPAGWMTCYGGRCAKNSCGTFDKECQNELVKCPHTGECRQKLSQCENADGCPSYKPTKCWNGDCKKTTSDCPSEISCGTGMKRCPDGSCVLSASTCPNAFGCDTAEPFYCKTKESCVADVDSCPASDKCPPEYPFKCRNGLCVKSSNNCPAMTAAQRTLCKDRERKVLCANSRCYESAKDCPALVPCPNATARCNDGSCRANVTHCPAANTCPSKLPYRCPNGMCEEEEDKCKTSNGCPAEYPDKCASTGRCVNLNYGDSCEEDEDILKNGCFRKAPYKCENGACVLTSSYCLNSDGCPSSYPIKCKAAGVCVDSTEKCNNVSACSTVLCPNGLCVASKHDCKTKSGCPITKPKRCPGSGACVKNKRFCPAAIICDEYYPVKCEDGSCVASQDECTPVLPCTSNASVRCPDATCAVHMDNCTQRCPPSSKFLCPNGKCVTGPSKCAKHGQRKCEGATFWCEPDQSCVEAPSECFENLANCTGYRCWDGSCEESVHECDKIPPCPESIPFRCPDGSCKNSTVYCTSMPACSNGEQRCPDGLCHSECPAFRGCMPGKIRCDSGYCADNETVCNAGCPSGEFMCINGDCKAVKSECPNILGTFDDLKVTYDGMNNMEIPIDLGSHSVVVNIPSGGLSLGGDGLLSINVAAVDDAKILAIIKNNKTVCSTGVEITVSNSEGVYQSVNLSQPSTLEFPPQAGGICNGTVPEGKMRCIGFIDSNSTFHCTSNATMKNGTLSGYTDHFTPYTSAVVDTATSSNNNNNNNNVDNGSTSRYASSVLYALLVSFAAAILWPQL